MENGTERRANFVVETCPDPSNKKNWQEEDIQGPAGRSMLPDEMIDIMSIPPLCLFPTILPKVPGGGTVIVHQGSALFPTSHVRLQAVMEKKQHEEELARAVSDARSKVNARRISCSTGRNSPEMGKFPTTQI